MMNNINNDIRVPTDEQFRPYTRKFNNQILFEPKTITKTGSKLEFKNTYNDECELIKVYGDSYQEHNRIAVKSGNILQFDDHKGDYMVVTSTVDCTITRCGRNLLSTNNYKIIGAPSSSIETISETTNFAQCKVVGPTDWFFGQATLDSKVLNLLLPNSNYTVSLNNRTNWRTVRIARSNGTGELSPHISLGGKNYAIITTNNLINTIDNQIIYFFTPSNTIKLNSIFELKDVMFEIGSVAHDYEAYIGNEFTLTANTPTKIPLLPNFNTIYSHDKTTLEIQYIKSNDAEEDANDLFTPTIMFPEEIICVNGSLNSYNNNLISSINIPNLYAIRDLDGNILAQDILYIDKKQKRMWIQHHISPAITTEKQYLLEEPIIEHLEYNNLRTFQKYTSITSNNDMSPTIEVATLTYKQYPPISIN